MALLAAVSTDVPSSIRDNAVAVNVSMKGNSLISMSAQASNVVMSGKSTITDNAFVDKRFSVLISAVSSVNSYLGPFAVSFSAGFVWRILAFSYMIPYPEYMDTCIGHVWRMDQKNASAYREMMSES